MSREGALVVGPVCLRRPVTASIPQRFVRSRSPLSEKPAEADVHLRSDGGERKLSDLAASLDGHIQVDLIGHADSDQSPQRGHRP